MKRDAYRKASAEAREALNNLGHPGVYTEALARLVLRLVARCRQLERVVARYEQLYDGAVQLLAAERVKAMEE